ncbi:MAG: hypothetical protein A2Z18_05260 [Armatimonadetes bacterium RBG_16_58_9]|nr:MAG: hypothetical protein A2Z18_05260 [Armatimonadetes bacterium RBG_16_58_9]
MKTIRISMPLLMMAVMLIGMAGVSSAETVSLTPEGDLTVIEAVAPLGSPLTYVSGGNGLIGVDGSFPTLIDTPANRAIAVNSYDHTWMQYDPEILWKSGAPLCQVFAIPGVDHDPLPGESLEFIIWGSDDAAGAWEEGKILAIYRDGFDTADTLVGHSDDYTSLWGFDKYYTFFKATSGDHVVGFDSSGEGEIDGLAAPVPEPSALLFLGSGLGASAVGLIRRRNKAS